MVERTQAYNGNERFSMTRIGYEALQRELLELEARQQEHLDHLSEFSPLDVDPSPEEGAYADTKRFKEFNEDRIQYLRFVLDRADVVESDPDPKTIDPGDRVTLWDLVNKENVTLTLIGSPEAVIGREGVSIDSPVGQTLHKRRVGDLIDVEVPDGRVRYIVRKIERS